MSVEHPRIIMLSQNMISINYNTKYFIGQSMIFGKNLCVKSGSLDPFPYKSVDCKAYLATNPWKLGFN